MSNAGQEIAGTDDWAISSEEDKKTIEGSDDDNGDEDDNDDDQYDDADDEDDQYETLHSSEFGDPEHVNIPGF